MSNSKGSWRNNLQLKTPHMFLSISRDKLSDNTRKLMFPYPKSGSRRKEKTKFAKLSVKKIHLFRLKY